MGLLESVSSLFGAGFSLYDVLGCGKGATQAELTKGYKKASLLCHPDKGGEQDKFICLGAVHRLLSDPEARSVYDETGAVEDAEGADGGGDYQSDMDWTSYWRALFPEVTLAGIDAYAVTYRGSDQERQDVLKAYVLAEGDMRTVIAHVPLSDVADISRFVESYIRPAIESKEVRQFAQLKKWAPGVSGPARPQKRQKKEGEEEEEDEEESEGESSGEAEREKKKKTAKKKRAEKEVDLEDDEQPKQARKKKTAEEGGKKKTKSRAGKNKKSAADDEEAVEQVDPESERKILEQIQKRKKTSASQLDALVNRLTSRHSKLGKEGKNSDPPLPDDAEFERVQRAMLERRKGGGK